MVNDMPPHVGAPETLVGSGFLRHSGSGYATHPPEAAIHSGSPGSVAHPPGQSLPVARQPDESALGLEPLTGEDRARPLASGPADLAANGRRCASLAGRPRPCRGPGTLRQCPRAGHDSRGLHLSAPQVSAPSGARLSFVAGEVHLAPCLTPYVRDDALSGDGGSAESLAVVGPCGYASHGRASFFEDALCQRRLLCGQPGRPPEAHTSRLCGSSPRAQELIEEELTLRDLQHAQHGCRPDSLANGEGATETGYQNLPA